MQVLCFSHRLECYWASSKDTCSDMSMGWGGEVEEIGISDMHTCLKRFTPEVVFAPGRNVRGTRVVSAVTRSSQ